MGFHQRDIVFFRDHGGDENWRAASVDTTDGAIVPLSPDSSVKSFIQESEGQLPEEMLARHNRRDKHLFDLFRINVVTGKSELVSADRQPFPAAAQRRRQPCLVRAPGGR